MTTVLPPRTHRVHPAWWVAAVTFLALIGAAAFRAVPGVLIDPLHEEFGWSLSTISLAIAINLALYGLTAPFAAALMERFGIRRVVVAALLVVAVSLVSPLPRATTRSAETTTRRMPKRSISAAAKGAVSP